MLASTKAPRSIRHGGRARPMRMRRSRRTSASRLPTTKPGRFAFSGGGGERDSHRSHDPARKGGGPARSPLQDDP